MDRLFMSPLSSGMGAFNMACEVSTLDAFPSTLNGEFELDGPMLIALAANLAKTDPNSAALLLAASMPPSALPQNAATADSSFDRLWASTKDSLVGEGNIGGNIASGTEAVLRAAWKRQAMNCARGLGSWSRFVACP